MKRFLSGFMTFALFHSVVASADECAAAGGYPWTMFDNSQFFLTQSGGSFGGPHLVPYCYLGTNWTAVGSISNGVVAFTSYHPFGGEEVCVASATFAGTIDKPGCNTGHGTWVNSESAMGSWTWQKTCDVPSYESTTAYGWNGPIALFGATLAGSTYSLGGRDVTEQNPSGDTTSDTCWFAGSTKAYNDHVTGGSWPVHANNQWGDGTPGYDGVGWNADSVNYYRSTGRAPCGATFSQEMKIGCSASNPVYDTNVLTMYIYSTFLTSSRDGNSQYRAY